MGFWDNVKKKTNEVWSGADFWDKEENQVQRNNAATGRNDVYVPKSQPVMPQQTFFDKVRDVADANSPMDIYRRESNAAPKMYAQEQKLRGIGRISDNPLERTVNTVKAIGEGISESPKAFGEYLASSSNDVYYARRAEERAIAAAQEETDRIRGKLADPTVDPVSRAKLEKYYGQRLKMNEGLVKDKAKSDAEFEKISDPNRAAMAGADMAFTVATAGVGAGGVSSVKQAFKTGATTAARNTAAKQTAKEVIDESTKAAAKTIAKQTGKQVPETVVKPSVAQSFKAATTELGKQSALGAATAAPSGAFGTAVINPDADAGDIAKGALYAGAFGAALPVAGLVAKPVANVVGKTVVKPVVNAVGNATVKPVARAAGKGVVKVTRAVDRQLPGSEARIDTSYYKARVDDANKQIDQYYKALEVETNTQRAKDIARGLQEVRKVRNQAIADLEKANKGLIRKKTADRTARERIDELSDLTARYQKEADRQTNPIKKAQMNYRAAQLRSAHQQEVTRLQNPDRKNEGGFIGGLNAKEIAKYKKALFDTPGGKRFEASDEGLKATGILNSTRRKTTADQLIDHPELFKNYPQLKDYTIVIEPMPSHYGGWHRAGDRTIALNSNRPANARLQTLMHELTHAIDNVEGYKGGGGPSDSRLTAMVRQRTKEQGGRRDQTKIMQAQREWREGVRALNDLKEKGGSKAAIARAQKQVDELQKAVDKETAKKSTEDLRFEAYQNYWGETGARTVSNRLGLTDEQRKLRPFLSDLDNDSPARILSLDEQGNVIQVDISDTIPKVTSKNAPAPTMGNPAIHPTMKGAKISAPDGGGEFPNPNPIRIKRKPTMIRTAPPQKYAPVEVENNLRTQTATAFIDKDTPLIKVLKRMERATGQTGLVERFYYDSGLQSRANSIANNKIATSEQLAAAMQGLGRRQLKEFNDYAGARAELNMANKGMKTSRPKEELKAIVDELGEEYGERFTSLNKFYKERAKDLYDAGIIDKDKYKSFIDSDDYIRIQRDFDDIVGRTSGTGNSYSFGRSITSFKRKGSERELLPADQVVMEYTQQIQKEIQRNQTATNLIDVLSEYGMARRLTPKQAVNKNTIKRVVKGKTEIYEVDPVLKDVIDNIRPYQLNGLERIIGAPARLFRAGTTALSAPFSYANYIRDQAGSAINSTDVMATHIRHPQNIVTGFYQAAKDYGLGTNNDPMWQKFIAHAGDTTQYDMTRNVRDSRMISRELRYGQAGRGANAIMHPIRTLEDFNSITEKATRFQNFKGMYQKVLDETGDPDMAMQRATVAAWQNSVDFNRAGNIGRFFNLLIPYFNAGIQGTRQMGKSFTRSPGSAVATTAKAIGIVGMPLYYATAWNMMDDERREIYNNINDYEKENNVIFILPSTEQNQAGGYNVLKFPMPPGFKEVIMPGRRAIESFANKETMDFKAMAGDLMQAVAGPIQLGTPQQMVASVTPQFIKPSVQQGANKDFFTDKEIVPGHINNATDGEGNPIPEHLKATDYTSGTARQVGDLINQSPIRVEKFFKDTFGSVGQYGLNAVDNLQAGLKGDNKFTAENESDHVIGGKTGVSDIHRRFFEATAKENHNASEGTKYYKDVEKVMVNRTPATINNWESIHPSKSNFLGDEIYQKSIVDSGVKAGVYLKDPEVFEIDRELDEKARKRGKPGNPIFDLTPDQRQTVLSMQANKAFNPGDKAMIDVIENQNPWLKPYMEAQSAYFDAIMSGKSSDGKSPNGIPKPQPSEEVQRMFDVAGQITDPAMKSQFYKENPELTEYLSRNEDYNRAKRAYLGLPQLDRFPENPQMKALEEQYFAITDKGARKAFMANNPGLSDYWLEKNLWQLNEAGARARFEGEELDESAAKDIMSIARALGGSGGFGGGGGGNGGGGRTYGISNTANAPEITKSQVKGVVRIARNKSTPGKIAVKRGGRI